MIILPSGLVSTEFGCMVITVFIVQFYHFLAYNKVSL